MGKNLTTSCEMRNIITRIVNDTVLIIGLKSITLRNTEENAVIIKYQLIYVLFLSAIYSFSIPNY